MSGGKSCKWYFPGFGWMGEAIGQHDDREDGLCEDEIDRCDLLILWTFFMYIQGSSFNTGLFWYIPILFVTAISPDAHSVAL